MAATQAESQQNDREQQVLQDQPPDLSNSILQNGTEKNGARGIVGSDNLVNIKTKLPGHISHSVEMSQYRQEAGAGPPIHNSSGNGEPNTNNSNVDSSKLNSDGKPYPQNSEQIAGNDQNYGKGSDSGRNMQGYGSLGFPGRGNYHPDHHSAGNPVQNSADSNLHQNHPFSQFSPQSMRQGFPSSKPMPGTPMVPPRPPSVGPSMNTPVGGFSPHGQQQRFLSGQSISQPTGPTPTLNQLLQSSNPVHRYQNSYGEFGMQKAGEQGAPGNMPYNQTWPPQRPLASYSPQQPSPGYRNQPPGGVPPRGPQQQQQQQQPPYLGGPAGPGAPGPGAGYPPQQQPSQQQQQQQQQPGGPGSQPGSGSQQQQQQHQQYPPYPQRYPTPPGPGPGPAGRPQPFSPHQLNTPYGQQVGPTGQPQQHYGGGNDQRGGPWGPSPQPNQQQQHPPHPQQQQQPPNPPQQNQHPPVPSPSSGGGGGSGGGGPPSQPPQSPQHQPVPSPGGHQPQPSPQPHPHPQASPQPQHPPPSPGQHPPPHSPHPPPQQQHSQHLQQQSQHPQQSQFPNRPQQSSTPNAHAPETGDLTGQNSNDSSSGLGPAPGTPGMRPTPSPTGSTGSRSMSPAVGPQNIPMAPHPSTVQPDGSSVGPMRMSSSPMSAQQQGGYPQQQPLAPPTHMHAGYKMGGGQQHPGMGPGGPQMGPYPPQGQQYPQGNYNPRPQGQIGNMQYGPNQGGYGPGPGPGPGPAGQQNPQANNMGPGGQYPRMPNHMPHSQFSSGYQGWGSPTMTQGPPNMMGKGPPQQPNVPAQQQQQPATTPGQGGPRPHTPPNYLKQHLQHKMGFNAASGMPPSPGPYGPGNGPNAASPNMPPGSPGMGPPPGNMHHMGSAMGPPPPSGHHHPGMGPPPPGGLPMSMGPPGPGSGMGPPSSTGSAGPTAMPPSGVPPTGPPHPPPPPMANSHGGGHHEGPMPPPPSNSHGHEMPEAPHENDTAANPPGPLPGNSGPTGVTSVVTTGPDGTPLDDGSQQSTLSNASAASGGDDPSCTPKSRGGKGDSNVGPGGGYHSHPATPLSTAPSPGAASVNSMHEEYGEVNSPSWPRTPASPVFNSHVHQDPYRSKKPDSLCKLYEMDESHERRVWLDKLLQYMEERGTPITSCPTISKNPLDLFRLYLYVKERGGFMEVCKVTKNKTWKDIAGLLGIGASSSAAYTLRKHYTKNLLAYECMFDRGGIDPQPIINQVEATSKKKGPKAASVPSPGSSNSQDSFPAAGSSGASMDGYGYGGYPPGSASDYNSQPMQRPASQANAPSPHPGMQQGYPQGHPQAQGGGYAQYPDQYNRGPPQEYNQQYPPGPGGNYPPNRPMYPPYGPEGDRSYNQGGGPGNPAAPNIQQGAGPDPYNRYPMGPGQQPPGYPARTGYGGPPGPAPPAGPPAAQQAGPGYPGQQDYYRQEQQQGYPGQQPPAVGGPGYAGGPPSKSMPPPAPQPRRHPDFATKEQQQQQQQAAPFPPYGQQQPPPQRPNMYGGWNNSQYRGQYPPQGPGPQGPQQWNQGPPRPPGPPSSQPVNNQWDQHRYNSGQQPPYQASPQAGPQQWPPNMSSPGVGPNSPLRPQMGPRQPFRSEGKPFGPMQPPGMKQPTTKREIVFPLDSVESTVPVLYKRKRMSRADVAPVEAWRLMMSLRSGLLAESCWALDVLNILLFDDSSVAYFGLAHLPGLLDVLLEHFRKSLANMFDTPPPVHTDGKWYGLVKTEQCEIDLGSVLQPIDCNDRVPVLGSTANYTLLSRKGEPIRVVDKATDIFIVDSHKVWDVEGEVTEQSMTAEVEQDPWQLTSADNVSTKYIVTCFQGEFGNVPFVRLLSKKVKQTDSVQEETADIIPDTSLRLSETIVPKIEPDQEKTEVVSSSENANVIVSKEDVVIKELVIPVERKNCEKKKRTKTLSDVLSRIKKEPADVNDILAREIREKVEKNEIVMKMEKEDETNDGKPIVLDDKTVCNDKTNVLDDKTNISEDKINCIDKSNATPDKTIISDVKAADKTDISGDRNSFAEVKTLVSSDKTDISLDKIINVSNDTTVVPNADSKVSNDTARVCNDTTEGKKTNLSQPPEEPMETDEVKSTTPAEEKKSTETNLKEEEADSDEAKKLQIRDPAGTLKRRRISDYEDECYARDEASLYLVTETQDSLARRCVCLSNILRNLTFVPGNEVEFAKNAMFLGLLGKLLLLHHEHPVRTHKQRNYDREEDADFADSCSSLQGEGEWWWEFLHQIRENVLVTAANIAGHMDLSQHPEEISRPVLDGLLHWAVCPAAHGQDPFPTVGISSPLSPQRLALEALCKLCVTDANVDLVIATPPYSRLERLCGVLTKFLSRSEEQVLREFAVNLLHYLAAADSGVARTVALQSPCVSLLVAFVEQAEASALGVANQHGIGALRDNPDSMGTSLDMLRRAAGTLLHLARHPDNRPLFLQQEQRLLALVMSQILDQQVASIISRVLFQCSRPHPEMPHRVAS